MKFGLKLCVVVKSLELDGWDRKILVGRRVVRGDLCIQREPDARPKYQPVRFRITANQNSNPRSDLITTQRLPAALIK